MSSVDQRIVEMQFDNRQFEQNVSKSLHTLDSLKKGLDLDKSAKSLDGLQNAAKHFSLAAMAENIQYVANKFSALGILGVTAMQRISNAAITTGKNLISALTIDPVKTGFREYETQMNAIQTILSNTRSKGTGIEQVNAALDELNDYADKTIYNFTEMTRNIGTFTAAGIDLDKSTNAIKGIANLAAVSGSTSQQASTAMYQLSQALSSGTVRLMDWNSVVNAGMGGEVFQNALKETARVHDIAIDDIIKKQGSFRESLQEGWLTSDVLIETLQKFTGDLTKEQIISMGYTSAQADEILALGKDASDAATKVKTFTQLLETLKEALGSGWTQSWENIIGNFEEARQLWTKVSDVIGGVITKNAAQRNALLSGWKELGGRDDLLEGLSDIFSSLWSVVVAVGDAMRDIFPKTTVNALLSMSKGVKEFGANLKSILNYREQLIGQGTSLWTLFDKPGNETTVSGFFGDLVKGAKGENVKSMQRKLEALGYELGSAGVDGIFGPVTEAALKKYQSEHGILSGGIFNSDTYKALFGEPSKTMSDNNIWTNAGDSILIFSDALEKVRSIAKGFFAGLSVGLKVLTFVFNIAKHIGSLLLPLADVILTVGAALGNAVVDFNDWLESSGLFSKWLEKIKGFLAPVGKFVESVGKSILKFFGFGDAAEGAMDKLDTFPKIWKKISDTVKGLGVWDKVKAAMDRVKQAFADISPVIKDYYNKVKTYLGDKFMSILGKIAEKIPVFIDGFVNFFIKILDFIDPLIKKIPKAIEAIKGFFSSFFDSKDASGNKIPGILSKVKNFFSGLWTVLKGSEKVQKIWKSVKTFFSDVWTAIKSIFSPDEGSEVQDDVVDKKLGLFQKIGDKIAIGWERISSVFKGVFRGVSDFLNWVGVGGLVGIIGLILGISSIVKIVTSVKSIVSGFTTVASIFANKGLKIKKAKSLTTTLFQFVIGLGIIVGALYLIGSMNPTQLTQGGVALGVIIGVLIGVMVAVHKLAKTDVSTQIALVGRSIMQMGIALGLIAGAIYILGTMSKWQLVRGGAAMVVIMGLVGGFMMLMKKMGPTNVNIKGLIEVAGAVAILAFVARLVGGMDMEKFWRGFGRMAAIMGLMTIFMAAVGKVGKGTSSIQLGGLMKMAFAVGILAVIARLIGGIDKQTFWSGMGRMSVIMVAMLIFTKSLAKVGKGTIQLKGLFTTAIAIGIVAGIAALLGNMSTENLIRGVLGLVGVVIAFKLFAKSASKLGIKSGIGSAVALLGLAAVMVSFSIALRGIKDIDDTKIKAFSFGLAAIMGSFGYFIKMTSTMSLGGIGTSMLALVGIVVAIGAIVAAFSALTKIPGFQDFMNNGASSIGEIIGSFIGSLKAAELKAFGSGLSELGDLEVNDEGVKNAIAAAQLVADFAEGLPDTNIWQQIVDAVFGTDLENFSNGMAAFGTAFGIFAVEIGKLPLSDLAILTVKTANAVLVAGLVSSFSNGLNKMSFWDKIATKFTKVTELSAFSNDLAIFSEAIVKFGSSMGGFTPTPGLREKTDLAVSVAGSVAGFSNSLDKMSFWDKIATKFTKVTELSSFSKDLTAFAKAIAVFDMVMHGVNPTPELIDKTNRAIAVAAIVAGFSDGLSKMSFWEKVGTGLTGLTSLNSLSADMPTFATSFNSFSEEMAKVELKHGNLSEKTTAAVGIAQSIANLSASLPDITLLDRFIAFFNGRPAMSFLGLDMVDFASGFNSYADIMSTIENIDSEFEKKSGIAVKIAKSISEFSSALPEVTGWDRIRHVLFMGTSVNYLNADMIDFSIGFNSYAKIMSKIKNVDSSLAEKSTIAVGIAKSIAELSAALPEGEAFQKLSDLLAGGSDMVLFTESMVDFSDGFNEYAGIVNGITVTDDLVTKTDAMVAIATSIARLNAAFSTYLYGIDMFRDVVGEMDSIGQAITDLDAATSGVDATRFSTIMNATAAIIQSLANLMTGVVTDAPERLKTTINELIAVLADESFSNIDTTKFLSGLDSKPITDKLSGFVSSVETSALVSTENLSSYAMSLSNSGAQLGSALNSGILSTNSDSNGMTVLIGSMLSRVSSYVGQFQQAGVNLGRGVGNGIRNSIGYAVSAATSMGASTIQALKRVLGIHSPSKEGEKIAYFLDKGVADGLTKYGSLVSTSSKSVGDVAMSSLSETLSNLSNIVSSRIDAEPVVRPVVDLSNVTAGSKAISGLLGRRGTISVDSVQSKALANSIHLNEKARTVQNGSSASDSQAAKATAGGALITGNTFYVRNEQDIHSLASEFVALSIQQQRGLGAEV